VQPSANDSVVLHTVPGNFSGLISQTLKLSFALYLLLVVFTLKSLKWTMIVLWVKD